MNKKYILKIFSYINLLLIFLFIFLIKSDKFFRNREKEQALIEAKKINTRRKKQKKCRKLIYTFFV